MDPSLQGKSIIGSPLTISRQLSSTRRMKGAEMNRFRIQWLVLVAIGSSFVSWPEQLRADPATDGAWTGVLSWGQAGGIEAIHTFMLPTGKVLFWQTWRESVGLWDPATNLFSNAAYPNPASAPGVDPFNPFCAGHTWLPDGRLMVLGGHISNNNGMNRANIYNPFTNTWANNVPNMPNIPAGAPYGVGRNGRWYPAATTLGNGDVLALSGDMNGEAPPGQSDTNPLPQVYQVATNTWRNLTTAYKTLPLYPRTFLAPDGRVVSLSGNSDETEFLDTNGTGSWSFLQHTLDSNLSNYGPAVMYDTGKIAYLGGGWIPTKNVSMIDLNSPTPTWTYGAEDMAQPRRQDNATILADGTVLITGGSSIGGGGPYDFNNSAGQIALAEIWDPATQDVKPVAPASSVYRGYHSTALLLPDGRVLVAGGNHDQPLPAGGSEYVEQKTAEIYSPPYLFAPDGSPAVRPTVTAAPGVAELGDTIFVQTPDAASISKALWIVPGAVTHAENWSQRANTLEFCRRRRRTQHHAARKWQQSSARLLHVVPGQQSGCALRGQLDSRHAERLGAGRLQWRRRRQRRRLHHLAQRPGFKVHRGRLRCLESELRAVERCGGWRGGRRSSNSRAVDPHGAGPRGDHRCELSRSASQFDLLTLAFEANCGRL